MTWAVVQTSDFVPMARWSRQHPVWPKFACSWQAVPPASWSMRTIGYRKESAACFVYGESPVPILNTGEATDDSDTSNDSTPLPVVNVATVLKPASNPLPATAWRL